MRARTIRTAACRDRGPAHAPQRLAAMLQAHITRGTSASTNVMNWQVSRWCYLRCRWSWTGQDSRVISAIPTVTATEPAFSSRERDATCHGPYRFRMRFFVHKSRRDWKSDIQNIYTFFWHPAWFSWVSERPVPAIKRLNNSNFLAGSDW